jgi:hypothetical protein
VLLGWQAQQVTEAVGSNTVLLLTTLSVTLLTAVATGYRFVVNLRRTERVLSRERVRQANANERRAQHEASLWQAWAADLEYVLRKRAGSDAVPRMPKELLALIDQEDHTHPATGVVGETPDQDGRSPGP